MMADLKVFVRDYWKTLTRPSPLTFAAISYNGHGRLALSMVIAILLFEISIIGPLVLFKNSLGVIIRIAFEAALGAPVIMLLWAFSIYKICHNVFHRKKSEYECMLYVLAVILAVSQLFTFVAIPTFLLSPVVSDAMTMAGWIYLFLLASIAISAIARLPIWQAILTVLTGAALAAAGGFAFLLFLGGLIRTLPFTI